tara:strand:+ start:463 stop:1209 length:747 start_codon:yes stop_codon:yes gene_type:complete
MAIDMKKMRQKLAALQNKGGGNSKNAFWKPQDGDQTIRIVPTPDGDPFKEYWFYYNIGKTPILCPKKNFGEESAIFDFATELYREGTPDSIEMAKKLFPKQRFFSPVVVRGEEDQGVRVWGYSRTVYEQLLNLVLDPDYDDITDPDVGTDLTLTYGKKPGAMFPSTNLKPKRKSSVLCEDGDAECLALLEQVPDFSELFERKTPEEVAQILKLHLNKGDGEETEKYGATPSAPKQDEVDKAFNELLDS